MGEGRSVSFGVPRTSELPLLPMGGEQWGGVSRWGSCAPAEAALQGGSWFSHRKSCLSLQAGEDRSTRSASGGDLVLQAHCAYDGQTLTAPRGEGEGVQDTGAWGCLGRLGGIRYQEEGPTEITWFNASQIWWLQNSKTHSRTLAQTHYIRMSRG